MQILHYIQYIHVIYISCSGEGTGFGSNHHSQEADFKHDVIPNILYHHIIAVIVVIKKYHLDKPNHKFSFSQRL